MQKNPQKFVEAFTLTEQKSLKIFIKACQSLRFNSTLNEEALNKKPKNIYSQIFGQKLAMSASKAFKREIEINATSFEKKFTNAKLSRKTFFAAEKFRVLIETNQKNKYWLGFELRRGAYATVFLKYLEAWLNSRQSK